MILNTYSKIPPNRYSAFPNTSRIYVGSTVGDISVTLQDIYDLLLDTLDAIKKRGFKLEKPSRSDLMTKLSQVEVETIEMRKDMRRMKTLLDEVEDAKRNKL